MALGSFSIAWKLDECEEGGERGSRGKGPWPVRLKRRGGGAFQGDHAVPHTADPSVRVGPENQQVLDAI
jgi:hypothetical protein